MIKIYQQLSLKNVSVQGAPWKKGGKTVRARDQGERGQNSFFWTPLSPRTH